MLSCFSTRWYGNLADIKCKIPVSKHVHLITAAQEEGYEEEYEFGVPDKPSTNSTFNNKFSIHLN